MNVEPPRLRVPPALQRARKPWEEIVLVVGSAIGASFLLDALIDPPDSWLGFFGRILGSTTRIALAIALGVYLGSRAWPRRGARLGAQILRRSARGKTPPLLVLTDRPDFAPSTARRIWETVGFVAGTSVLFTAALALAGITRLLVLPSGLYVLLALWASFLLVPYWTFARMGLRRVDPVRWTVEPLSQRYGRRLRLSNGALLVVALSVSVTLAVRAGQTGNEALLGTLRLLGQLVAAILVVVATAVAWYARAEKRVYVELEKEALATGVRDGRRLSDGEFLPRVV